jgi:hypothetical protein
VSALLAPEPGLYLPSPAEIDWSDPVNRLSGQAEGLVALYAPFADAGINLARDLGYAGRHLAFGATTQAPTWTGDGEFVSVLDFVRASSQYAELGQAGVTAAPLTLVCWFRSDDTTNAQTLISLASSTADEEYFRLRTAPDVAGGLRADTRNVSDGIQGADTTTAYSANVWYHGAAVWASPTDRRVFINGGSKGTQSVTCTPAGINRTSLGRLGRLTPTQYLSGRIAEARIYNRALSDAEVYGLYDPATRWELYRSLQRGVYSAAAAAATLFRRNLMLRTGSRGAYV